MKKQILILSCILMAFTACQKEETAINSTDFTQSTYQSVILPLHKTFIQKLKNLQSAVNAFSTDLSMEKLNNVKTEWEGSYLSYTPTKAFNIDNIKDNYSHLYFQKFPVDTQKVNMLVNTDPNNAIVSSNAKGLAAIEYLLYRNAALDSFQNNANTLLYLQALTNDLAIKANELNVMWEDNDSKYIQNKEISSDNAFNQLVNGIIQFTENLKMLKVGNPLGKQSLDNPNHLLSQAPYSNTSKKGIQTDFQLLYKLWSGGKFLKLEESVGLRELLQNKNKELCNNIDEAFNQLEKDIQALPTDLNTAFENMDERVNKLYTDLNNLYILLKVDLSAQLDVTVFISDLDGD
ncbi:imelysin family protein [Lishizhenia sp.]|uniref:imelysin family protein n=1 Tax=Lishizhenia sp. TaxID=2497594 RepID=UPI00299CD4CF|nr:imelysin family protein [Lishizhenia sp.]MDX1446977.1 imelysin family protein [Lishizhenia sp.]